MTVRVSLRVDGPDGTAAPDALRHLLTWLRREPVLGNARLAPSTPHPEHLGGIADVITIVLGTAGGGAALAGALTVWLQTRTAETRVSATVEKDGQSWTYEAATYRKPGQRRFEELEAQVKKMVSDSGR